MSGRVRSMAGAHLLALLSVALLCWSAAAQQPVIRSDNSPICNQYLPQCEAKCKRGETYIFVCSAGNGPRGGPYIICRCAAPFAPQAPQQMARLVLSNWPGAKACNDKTWINDCTSQMTAQVNGSNVLFTPAVSNAFNEKCDPAGGIVIGPKGTQAAVSFPQYPIGITSTGPDGTLQIDFSSTAADDPNNMDWTQCIISYKIIQGSFLNPAVGAAAMAGRQNQLGAQQQQKSNACSSSSPLRVLLLLATAVAAVLLL